MDGTGRRGRVPVLELGRGGALLGRDELGGAIAIFVRAPLGALETRLRARATESSGEIEERLAIARRQLEHEDDFDEVVRNDDLATAVEAIAAVVERGLAGRVYHARP